MTKAVRWSEEQFADHRKKLGNLADNSRGIVTVKAPPDPKAKPKRSKHRNKKVVVDGITHDSEKEARRWAQLQQMEKSFLVVNLRRQVPFELAPAARLKGETRKKPALRYVADFVYVLGGVTVIEDVKSEHTRTLRPYRDRKHLMKTVLGLDVTEI